jgi:Domain of unknown function (DUF4833)
MIGLLLLTLPLLPAPAWSIDLPLFFIQRSKNANEVHYHLQVDDRCHLVSNAPVSAVWKLLEDSPDKTASLSVFDHMAYGVAQQRVADNGVSFSLKALEQKRIHASAAALPQMGTCSARAQVEINGQRAVLERIYVQTEEGWLKPKVIYVDVFGTSMDTRAAPVRERLTP